MIGFSGIRGSVKHSLTSRIDKGRKEIISFLKKHVTAANYKVTPTVPRTRRDFMYEIWQGRATVHISDQIFLFVRKLLELDDVCPLILLYLSLRTIERCVN
jgi:hypothetical protein